MAWVNSEYADELAVVSTWIATLLPWTVSYTDRAPLSSIVVFLRFGLFEIQLRFPSRITFEGVPLDVRRALDAVYVGVSLGGNFYAALPHMGALAYGGRLGLAYWLYAVAWIVLLAALVLSVAMYLREADVSARLPIEYVRLAGVLLVVVTLALIGSTALLASVSGVVGTPIPVGLVVLAALAAALVGAERVDESKG